MSKPQEGVALLSADSMADGGGNVDVTRGRPPKSDKKHVSSKKGHKRPSPSPTPHMSFIGLCSMLYFLICGGSYGLEDIAGALPPLYAILGILIVPWLWSLPTALVTAELATTYPGGGGFVDWTRAAWGDTIAQVDGTFMCFVMMVDAALEPTIFAAYLTSFFSAPPLAMYLIEIAFLVLCVFVNMLGPRALDIIETILQVVTMIPFVAFCGLGFFDVNFSAAAWLRTDGPWRPDVYLSVLLWASCGFDQAGFVANQIDNPKKQFPRALFITVTIMTMVYLLPVLVAIATYAEPSRITEGLYPVLGERLGYLGLVGISLTAGGCFSSIGTYMSYMYTTAQGLQNVADEGSAPAIFRSDYLPGYHIPIIPLILFVASSAILVLFDFEVLIQLGTLLQSVHTLLLMSLVPRLRMVDPDRERPYRLPFGTFGAWFLPLLPAIVSVAILVTVEITILLGGIVFVAFSFAMVLGYRIANPTPAHGAKSTHKESKKSKKEKKKQKKQQMAQLMT